ncbi:HD domain-containing phosphohydrolase [Pseudoduganella violacea]|uniref:HD-GYP domain-containing protein (C-di-GMP phosphodiesterase class II) n=1 Tax=Pseudoduganella violacea TaxID=1715466 RepID=A0A7W5B816_9BURK|nr:HD domain-containing phosphohydrolase [Pseudoduganella violacea]MBB3117910.1 HD-GYP domain-containing protein (c-di-GMP phosphodiesterase class II) [Pseudoduganella violacea]
MNISTAACPPAWVSTSECLRALAFVGDLAAARLSIPRHPSWLVAALNHSPPACGERPNGMLSLEEMADLIDLQQPWLCGHSRRVAMAAQRAASQMGLDEQVRQRCYRAGLVHGIGRGAIPSEIWSVAGPLSSAVREQLRLAPYWTWRALREVEGLAQDAEIASYAGERLDGSGNFRGAIGAVTPLEGQVLAAASAWIALQAARPWRPAYSSELSGALLAQEAAAGRFHPVVVEVLRGAQDGAAPSASAAASISLSERESEVLRAISQGQTNKQVARQLAISPRTVGTHVESAFRKLGCTTRAAAALKARTLRLI